MATREEFGKYLLLKKLTEDALGETFRAGRVGSQGMEQVVLLRALNGPRLDAARLVEALPDRAPIQQALKSPNIGNGVDLGDVRGVPFIAYDYISGRSLATLLTEAARQGSPVAIDHGLLIAERLAQALAVAYETRLGEGRLLHGFVVPPLVRISNEGETRLLGFEIGPLLQEMAGRGVFEPAVSAYLAPEILAGEPTAKSDDVYSLGALLFQLLTGEPPASGDPAGLVAEIDRAKVAGEETLIPAPIATLLKRSLTPRDNRIPEAVTWHKALNKIMIEGQYNATTFNLAFFMHHLFRAEIERETQELEAEKQIKPEEKVEPPAMPDLALQRDGDSEITGTHPHYAATSSEAPSRTGLWIGLAAAVAIAAAAGWYFLLGPGAAGTTLPAPEVTATQPVAEPQDLPPSPLDQQGLDEGTDSAAAEEEAAKAEASAQELQDQIQQMIQESNQDLEAKFKAQYEAKIQELQKQLSETQQSAERAREEARKQQEAEAQRLAEQAKKTPPEPTPEPETDTADERAGETRTASVPATGGTPGGSSGEAAAPGGGAPTNASGPASSGASTSPTPSQPQERVADRPSNPSSVLQPSQSAARPSTSPSQQPSTRPSSQPATPTTPEPKPPKVVPPDLVRQPTARYPELARRMGRTATVLLRVLVDETGSVAEVERIGKRVGSGFDEAAAAAARQAHYKPGTEDGRPKAMWTTLRIEFRPP